MIYLGDFSHPNEGIEWGESKSLPRLYNGVRKVFAYLDFIMVQEKFDKNTHINS